MIIILIKIKVVMNTRYFPLSIVAASLLATISVQANSIKEEPNITEEIERIEVTASKQSTTLLELPSSATVINQETIKLSGINRLTDIEKFVPNLKFSQLGEVGSRFISIRGVGANPLSENRTAVYIDDIPFTTINDKLLNDVSQIEVLRGPQGTIYGANTEGGVIVINTSSPIGDKRANLSISTEHYDQGSRQQYSFSNVTPLGDNWAFRFSVLNQSGDTYTQNIDPTAENPGEINDTSVLSSIHYDDGERSQFSLYLIGEFNRAKGIHEETYIPINTQLYNEVYATDNPLLLQYWGVSQANEKMIGKQHEYHMDGERFFDESERIIALKYAYDFDWTKMVFVSNYLNNNSSGHGAQFELTSLPILNSGGIDNTEKFFSELRFSGENDNVNWLVGASWLKSEREFIVESKDIAFGEQNFSQLVPFDETHLDYALFANVQWSLNDKWRVDLGIRAAKAEREAERKEIGILTLAGQPAAFFPIVDESSNFSDVLPKFALSYHINKDNQVYFNIAKGWQPGGINDDAFASEQEKKDGLKYDSEKVISTELGVKGLLQHSSLYWSANIFSSRAKDWHEMAYLVDELGRAASTSVVVNAGELNSIGAEFEFNWQYNSSLQFSGHIAFTDSEYKNFNLGENADYSGNSSILMPKNNASLRSNYQLNDQWQLTLQLNHFGKTPLDLDNQFTQKSYQLLDASINWQSSQWSVRAYVNNVFDEYYFTGQSFADFTIPVDGIYFSAPGTPRFLGLSVSYSFN
jgi:iron complex outermembrane receptor protein